MAEVNYLSVEDVIDLHGDILELTGSPESPLLHPDKLESAVARCRNVAYYEGADLIRQAVVLAVGISQNQPFMDGNKRAAFYAADMFLRINSVVYEGDPLEAARRLEEVAEADRGEQRDAATDRLEALIREHATIILRYGRISEE